MSELIDIDLENFGEVGKCGRPTKANKPCSLRRERFMSGCQRHRTDEETALGKFISDVQWNAWREGHSSATALAEQRIKQLGEEIQKLREEKDARDRRFTEGQDQLVEVDGYAYRWHGQPPLEVDEYVMIPCSYVDELQGRVGPKRGRVTALGTTYRGSLSPVYGRAHPPEDDTQ